MSLSNPVTTDPLTLRPSRMRTSVCCPYHRAEILQHHAPKISGHGLHPLQCCSGHKRPRRDWKAPDKTLALSPFKRVGVLEEIFTKSLTEQPGRNQRAELFCSSVPTVQFSAKT
jgi:hypothetical protein